MTRRWRRSLVIGFVAALMLALIGTNVVSAHARLTASTPAKDATVTTVPAQVLLTFSQETSATQSTGSVVNAAGTTAPTATRSAASAVATGTGGATLPVTGTPTSGGGTPWLPLVIIAGSLALVGGFALRLRTRRSA